MDQAADTFSGFGCRIHCGLVLMAMIMMMVVGLALEAIVLSGCFKRFPFCVPKLAPWSVDMSDKGVLQVVWALLLCDGNRKLLNKKQQHLRAEGRTIQRLLAFLNVNCRASRQSA